MKDYKEAITLNKNSRGCYILDTIKGCPGGSLYTGKGCYGACYAKNIADRYGFDFGNLKTRSFQNKTDQLYLFGLTDKTHTAKILKQIRAADMPFIRIGEMGDPSLDWEHTIDICNEISPAGKPIVIITKHWKEIPDYLLPNISKLNICVNTSVSALDDDGDIDYRLAQFTRLKSVCNSVLRIVSCNFNTANVDGLDRYLVQQELFKYTPYIDTVFRPNHNNYFVEKGIIKISKVKFLRSMVQASVYNKNTYMGDCQYCPDMCGINSCTHNHSLV